jgi:Tfp pilus assembly protein PilO
MPKGRFSASELELWRDQCDFKICVLKMKHLFIRAWRQKIEAWLQENEKEEKQNEELKRRSRRVQSNRRSLEADSGKYRSYVLKYLVVMLPVFIQQARIHLCACN